MFQKEYNVQYFDFISIYLESNKNTDDGIPNKVKEY